MNTNSSVLTLEQARNFAPAAFSNERAPGLSSRYHTFRTIDVVQPVLDDGWQIMQAGQAASYAERDNRFYKRHLLRISKPELVVEGDGDPYRIDCLLVNSNDGTKAFSVELGVYRFLCANGNVTADTFDSATIRHLYPQERVIKACEAIVSNAPRIVEHIADWKRFELTPTQALALAQVGAGLRWGKQPLVDPATLTFPRRDQDCGSDLWRTFNRVQENVIRGGQEYVNRNARSSKVREIRSIAWNLRINRGLWAAADRLFKGGDPIFLNN
jgi:Domain of unknown function (DUF932)